MKMIIQQSSLRYVKKLSKLASSRHLTISAALTLTADYRDIGRNYQMPHLTTSATSTATAYYGNIAANATSNYLRDMDYYCDKRFRAQVPEGVILCIHV